MQVNTFVRTNKALRKGVETQNREIESLLEKLKKIR